jgi:hypothetical protein
MKQAEDTDGGRNGQKLPFPFPGALGTADDPACGPPDPTIDRSEFGRMVLDARRVGIDICPTSLEPVADRRTSPVQSGRTAIRNLSKAPWCAVCSSSQ